MGILIVDILRIFAQLWMFSMHAAAMLFMCCSQVFFNPVPCHHCVCDSFLINISRMPLSTRIKGAGHGFCIS